METSNPPSKTNQNIGYAAALFAMVAGATTVYTGWEGTRTVPYQDVIGVWTVCSGDTSNVNSHTPKQTPDQCRARTEVILAKFGDQVHKLNPSLEDSPLEWGAHTVFAANVGMGTYGKSSVLKLSLAGEYRDACRAMRDYDKAGGKVFKGLQNRREGTETMIGEYELCLGGAVQREMSK